MIKMVLDTLIKVAKQLNLPIRDPQDMPTELYVDVKPDQLLDIVKQLKEDFGVFYLSTIQMFETEDGYHLLYPFSVELEKKTKKNENYWGKIILDVSLDKNKPELDSITHLIPGANVYERESYDMLGVKFRNHEGGFFDHTQPMRLLTADIMPEDLFPLRKEYSYTEIREALAEEAKKRNEEMQQ